MRCSAVSREGGRSGKIDGEVGGGDGRVRKRRRWIYCIVVYAVTRFATPAADEEHQGSRAIFFVPITLSKNKYGLKERSFDINKICLVLNRRYTRTIPRAPAHVQSQRVASLYKTN